MFSAPKDCGQMCSLGLAKSHCYYFQIFTVILHEHWTIACISCFVFDFSCLPHTLHRYGLESYTRKLGCWIVGSSVAFLKIGGAMHSSSKDGID